MSMNENEQLASERNAVDRRTSTTFGVFWALSALTTGLFGFEYVFPLYLPIVSLIPMEGATAVMISRVLGAISAVLLLDWAYIQWREIKLNNCETEAQVSAARSGENFAFFMSLGYTVIALATLVFNWMLNPELVQWMGIIGAASFVVTCAWHLLCWRKYASNTLETLDKAAAAETTSKKAAERINLFASVEDDALRKVKARINELKPEMVEELTAEWQAEIMDSMRSAMPSQRGAAPVQTGAQRPSLPFTIRPKQVTANASHQPVAEVQPERFHSARPASDATDASADGIPTHDLNGIPFSEAAIIGYYADGTPYVAVTNAQARAIAEQNAGNPT